MALTAEQKEAERLRRLLQKAAPERRAALEPVIDNLAWMRGKLDGAREGIADSQVVIPYDNGGGQAGIRENPAFRAYEALFRTYSKGVDMLISALPEADRKQAGAEKPKGLADMMGGSPAIRRRA